MATERLTIVIDEKGARVVSRKIKAVGKAAKKAGTDTDFLKKALKFTGIQASVEGVLNAVLKVGAALVDFTNTAQNLTNRLRVVTKSTAELNERQQQLFEISQRTRQSLEATTELFVRTSIATKELGLSTQELLEFTESLSQAVTLSGASSQESAAALTQLSQGLASGTLRGDELRSVLEQLPTVADIIAKELNVTRGQLRELGKDGKISAEVIINAFKSAKDELAEGIGKAVPTLGQVFEQFRGTIINAIQKIESETGIITNLTKFLGELVTQFGALFATLQDTGVLSLLASQLAQLVFVLKASLSQFTLLSKVLPFVSGAGGALAAGGGGGGDKQLLSSLRAIEASASAKAIDELVESVNALLPAFDEVTEEVTLSTEALNVFLSSIIKLDNAQKALVQNLSDFATGFAILSTRLGEGNITVKQFTAGVKLLGGEQKKSGRSGESAAEKFARLNKEYESLLGSLNPVVGALLQLSEVEEKINELVENEIINRTEANQLIAQQTKLLQAQLNPQIALLKAEEKAFENLFKSNDQREKETALIAARQALIGVDKEIADATIASLELQIDARQRARKDQKEGAEELQRFEDALAKRQAEIAQLISNTITPLDRFKESIRNLNQIFEEGGLPVEAYQKNLDIIQQQFADARFGKFIDAVKTPLDKFNESLVELTDAFANGLPFEIFKTNLELIGKELQKAEEGIKKLTDNQKSLANALQAGFQAAGDAITEFVFTGKSQFKSFGDFASSVIRDILQQFIRAQIQQFAARAAVSLVGGLNQGGAFTVPGFQHGADFMVGGRGGPDSKLVAFRATPGERVTVTPASQSDGTTNDQPTIVNILDPQLLSSFLASSTGQRAMINAIGRNPEQIRRILSR